MRPIGAHTKRQLARWGGGEQRRNQEGKRGSSRVRSKKRTWTSKKGWSDGFWYFSYLDRTKFAGNTLYPTNHLRRYKRVFNWDLVFRQCTHVFASFILFYSEPLSKDQNFSNQTELRNSGFSLHYLSSLTLPCLVVFPPKFYTKPFPPKFFIKTFLQKKIHKIFLPDIFNQNYIYVSHSLLGLVF